MRGPGTPTAFRLPRMQARGDDGGHRASSPLELLFDLCFVVAVSIAGVNLHHAVIEDHLGSGLLGFSTVFFAIWWAWMNFTWFASQFDTDDWLYRVFTLLQMAGVLVLAAGVADVFAQTPDFTLVTIGYFIMRVPLIAQWVRAGLSDPEHRTAAFRYAGGLAVTQAMWLLRLLLPDSLGLVSFLALVVVELSVPAFAERGRTIPWHAHHIAERYGLFTLIVLGESILAATNAFIKGFEQAADPSGLIVLAFAALVIVFGMWWVYFDHESAGLLDGLRSALVWGYGHYFIFGAAAAVSAGLEAAIDYDLEHLASEGLLTPEAMASVTAEQSAEAGHHISGLTAALMVNAAAAIFVLGVWVLIARHRGSRVLDIAYPAAVVALIAVSFTGLPIHLGAVVMIALVVVTIGSRPGVDPDKHVAAAQPVAGGSQ